MIYILILLILLLSVAVMFLLKKNISMKKLIEDLKESSLDHEKNNLLSRILSAAFKKNMLSKQVKSLNKTLLNYYNLDYCSIFIPDSRNFLSCVATNIPLAFVDEIEIYANDLLKDIKEDESAKILYSDYVLDYPTAKKRFVKYLYFLPLRFQGDLVGALLIENRQPESLEEIETDFFKIVVENLTLVIKNLLNDEKLRKATMLDGLTGVNNRDCLDATLP